MNGWLFDLVAVYGWSVTLLGTVFVLGVLAARWKA